MRKLSLLFGILSTFFTAQAQIDVVDQRIVEMALLVDEEGGVDPDGKLAEHGDAPAGQK